MNPYELPLGTGFALAQNPDAMRIFSNLPEDQQSEILKRAYGSSSKQEMENIVSDLKVNQKF